MWYRVELNKDGSVHACQQVDARDFDRRRIVYVEATNKAEAIQRAISWASLTAPEQRRLYARALKTGRRIDDLSASDLAAVRSGLTRERNGKYKRADLVRAEQRIQRDSVLKMLKRVKMYYERNPDDFLSWLTKRIAERADFVGKIR